VATEWEPPDTDMFPLANPTATPAKESTGAGPDVPKRRFTRTDEDAEPVSHGSASVPPSRTVTVHE